MFRALPKPERTVLRTVTAVTWAFTGYSAIGGIWFTGESVLGAFGPDWLVPFTSFFTLIGSVFALVGVLFDRLWWLEWLATCLAGMGLSYYVTVPWFYILGEGQTGRIQQSGMVVVALVGFVITRFVFCWINARRLYNKHQAEEAIKDAVTDTGQTPVIRNE